MYIKPNINVKVYQIDLPEALCLPDEPTHSSTWSHSTSLEHHVIKHTGEGLNSVYIRDVCVRPPGCRTAPQ